MKTLNKAVTRTFFDTDKGFEDLEARWSEIVKSDVELTATHHLIYAALRGKDWTKGFTPISNTVKLENGADSEAALKTALYWATSDKAYDRFVAPIFGTIISRDGYANMVKTLSRDGYKGDAIAVNVPQSREIVPELANAA